MHHLPQLTQETPFSVI